LIREILKAILVRMVVICPFLAKKWRVGAHIMFQSEEKSNCCSNAEMSF
jgi:hypothetical protein